MVLSQRSGKNRSVAAVVATVIAVIGGLVVAQPATAQRPSIQLSTAGTAQSWNFDGDAVGSVPAGCAATGTAAPAVVSDARGFQSAQSLRVQDPATNRQTVLVCDSGQARHGAHLATEIFPAAMPNGFTFSLLGHRVGATNSAVVFHFNVIGDGTLRWYDGRAWTPVTGAGAVPIGRWTRVDSMSRPIRTASTCPSTVPTSVTVARGA